MAELMKDKYYNYDSLHALALRIKDAYPSFPAASFLGGIIDETWDSLELKTRMRKITLQLGICLPADYEQALAILDKVVAGFPPDFYDFSLMCFPDFVEVYGQEERHWDLSIAALERYSPSSTSEMAVRPFLIKHQDRMMRQMALWAKSDNEHIRRLASEGCRPQLPWGQVLYSFKKDPSPVLAILELLKADPSLYVRKSVANNLNDISKTHPALIAKTARDWYGKDERTDWIVKHGCRTLLKNGSKDVLDIFGFTDARHVNIDGFSLSTTSVSIGENVTFSFVISAEETTKVRLEYGIDYVKANGKRSRKIFQISEIILKANRKKTYEKTHSFADLSSRKHYPGIHTITLIVNGTERDALDIKVIGISKN